MGGRALGPVCRRCARRGGAGNGPFPCPSSSACPRGSRVVIEAHPNRKYEPEYLRKRLGGTVRTTTTRGKRWEKLDASAHDPLDIEALHLLETIEGHSARTLKDGTISVTRPGHKSKTGATIGYHGPGYVKCWTSGWKPLVENAIYSLDDIERLLAGEEHPEHGGEEHPEHGGEEHHDDGKRKIVLTPAAGIKVRPVKWVWQDRMPLGSLTLIGGREGIGKSTLTYQLIADITRGRLDGHYAGEPRAVIVAATEDSWEHTIVPRLMAADADLDLVYRVDVVTSEGIGTSLSLPADLHALEEEAERIGAAAIVLDPLLSRLHASLDTHKDAEVRQALEPLVALADRCGAAVVGMIHVNKSTSTDPLTLLMGSRAFAAVARAVLFVMKSPDDDELRLIGQPKNNLGRTDQPTLQFTIASRMVADTDEGQVWTGAISWEGESDRSIADYLEEGAEGGSIHTAVGEAADWLHDFLLTQGGEARSKECKDKGGKEGFTHDASRRACKKLRIEVRAEGFPRVTWWSLRQSVHSPGETPPTHSTQPTGSDQVRHLRPVAAVDVVGAVAAPLQEDAPTGPSCERCSASGDGVSYCGTADQILCRACWVHPRLATESELF